MTFLGRARNEAFELILGDTLIAIGGVLLGLFLTDQNKLGFLIPIFMFFFIFGFIFDIRALNKFTFELGSMRSQINTTREELDNARKILADTIIESQKIKGNLELAKKDLQKAQRDLENSERALAETNQKIFGSSGSTFSRANWAHPIDGTVADLERKVKDLEQTVRNLQNRVDGLGRRF